MRPMPVLVVLLALAAPSAWAQGQPAVDLLEVQVPDRTLAAHPFPAVVRLQNHDGVAHEVTLFAALYAPEDGSGPCGSATSARFKTFTHKLQPRITLAPGATITYPPAHERWLQEYRVSDVPAEGAVMQWCVFVAENERTSALEYHDYVAMDLATRGVNAPPAADFSLLPARPAAVEPVRFTAAASDPDGDLLAYRWDFGHANASGRAVAEGPAPTHRFYPEGTYTVTLWVSDGFVETRVAKTVVVDPESAAATRPATITPQSGDERTPLPAWVILAAVALASAARRARS